jgi:hypothetical protein
MFWYTNKSIQMPYQRLGRILKVFSVIADKKNTVYPGYNEPRYNEYLAITNRVSGTGNQ